MLSENESEPFLKESDNESDSAPRLKSILEKQKIYSRINAWRQWSSTSSPLLSHCTVFLATSILWGSLFLFITHFSPHIHKSIEPHENSEPHGNFTSDAKFLTCGHSTPEAKNLGCQYDILSNHWVPDVCMDQEAVKVYQSDGSWFGYADENRTQLISIDTMSEMPFYYTSARDHIVHCAMLWRKQYNAFIEGRKNLDTIITSREHTEHCSKYLIDMTDWGTDFWNMPIKVFTGYAGCWVKD